MTKPPVKLDTPIQFVKGVGPRRAAAFAAEGIKTAGDLLFYLPFRYEDRSRFKKIAELRDGDTALVLGRVELAGSYRTPHKGMPIFEAAIQDDTASLSLKFFNQPFLSRVIRARDWVIVYGVARFDSFRPGRLSILNPEFETIDDPSGRQAHVGRITPIYRRVGAVTGKVIRQIVWEMVQEATEPIDPWMPPAVEARGGWPDRTTAVRALHVPPPEYAEPEKLARLNESASPFHQRLIFEEFFLFQTGLLASGLRKKQQVKERTLTISETIRSRLKQMLPFHPTTAQKKTLRSIIDDMRSPHPMSRLLQGDVGSGKTIVAAQATLVAVDNGWQVGVMAPTEILAEQHFRTFQSLFAPLGVRTEMLCRVTPARERRRIHAGLADGSVNVLVGTHALIQDGVRFANLGLAIIDEQHRFGVLQRSALMEKGRNVDMLIMTATPIPRTLALTFYGDLDISVIDQMPPGRKPIRTILKSEANREEVYQLLERQVAGGRQAYVVYPLIEESEKISLRAVEEMSQELRLRFSGLEVGVLHGRLKPAEKEALMSRFAAGKIQILAATTVVEVGIDVPNATVMVIEHAERFGLSQLHQLRGRVGRGSADSICILLVDRVGSADAWQRLKIIQQSQDGFRIAEKDLELRGPGEFAGRRQSGAPLFRHGNLLRDAAILLRARQEASQYLNSLSDPERETYLVRVGQLWKTQFHLSGVG